MNLSNPGDYPYDEDDDFDIDYEIIETYNLFAIQKAVYGLPFCLYFELYPVIPLTMFYKKGIIGYNYFRRCFYGAYRAFETN